MSSCLCQCKDNSGTTHLIQSVDDCGQCPSLCADKGYPNHECSCGSPNQDTTPIDKEADKDLTKASNTVIGLTLSFFIIVLVISIVLWIFMIWFSIATMRRCGGKPTWLNPTIITLLVLWLLFSWVPFLGFLFFLALLILCIVFFTKCKSKK